MAYQATELIDDRSFPTRVLEPPHATLVLFTARDCLPCGFLARRLPALAAELDGAIDVVRCPVEASPRTVQRYSVVRTPTFLLFMAGGLVASRVGPAPFPTIRHWVLEALKKNLEVAPAPRPGLFCEGRASAATRMFLRHVFSRPTALRACGVASVVAPVLLILNHLDLLLSGPFRYAVLQKLALNFLVPFLVSSVSSALAATRGTAPDSGATA